MPTYIQKIDQQSGICPTSHSPQNSSSGWRSAWFRSTVQRLGRALRNVQPDRAAVALSTRAAVVVAAAVMLMACGGGSASPTAPSPPVTTAPPAPAPTPPAPAANLVGVDLLGLDSCINGLCTFRVLVLNTGDACATNISGETWITSAQGVEVARVRWAMAPDAVLRPLDRMFFFGDNMPQIVLNHLDGRVQTSFLFNSRPCQ